MAAPLPVAVSAKCAQCVRVTESAESIENETNKTTEMNMRMLESSKKRNRDDCSLFARMRNRVIQINRAVYRNPAEMMHRLRSLTHKHARSR